MMIPSKIKLTECPRDAMQGLHQFIPTELKAAYINLNPPPPVPISSCILTI